MAISPCMTRIDEQGRELVQHGTALFPVACYYDDLTTTPVPWHWHDEMEAFVVSEGQMVVATEGAQYTLRQGEGCIINANVLHACFPVPRLKSRLHSVVFHPRLVGGSPESIFWQQYLLPVTEHPSFHIHLIRGRKKEERMLADRIEAAWQACEQEPDGYEFLMRSALSDLILLLRKKLPAAFTAPSLSGQRNELRLKQMLEYIRAHLSEEITVSGIAGAAAVSESECMRCFKRSIRTTPMQYVRELRLTRAAELLSDHRYKVNEVAERCGFHEMSYFARTFSERFGKTPSAYRREEREREE